MQTKNKLIFCYDPYDHWAGPFGIKIKKYFYQGKLSGKVGAVLLGVSDWLFPIISRQAFKIKKHIYPVQVAYAILSNRNLNADEAKIYLEQLKLLTAGNNNPHTYSWGLGLSWMSKNGLYDEKTPFVTNTPYVMEALLEIAKLDECSEESMQLFYGTWFFLESLKIMYQNEECLALSYAPVLEPRIVINANTYAAFAYALHAVYGEPDKREIARHKAIKLLKWVIEQQQQNGAWYYYADNGEGNFIDCFHSCFIIKNILKIKKLLPETSDISNYAVQQGWCFLKKNFYDAKKILCKRFIEKSIKDPFIWDLYDQAEYLGLLIDFGEIEQAKFFSSYVKNTFTKNDDLYCRIDIFDRLWGKNFLRWGICPFLYQASRITDKI